MATDDGSKSIREQREDLANEIKDVNSKLKPGFQKIISDLEEVSPQVAKITADFRESSRDTFTGALATKKLKNLTGLVDKYMSEGAEALDPKELKQLEKNFSSEVAGVTEVFDFEGMRQAQLEFNETQDKLQALEDGKQARLEKSMANNNVLATLDREIEEARSKSIGLQGAALEANTKLIEDLQRDREDKADKMTAAFDREIAAERKILEERTEALSETTDAYKKGLEEATKSDKLEKFSGGINELTGIDILGFADTVTKKVNAISDVMGSIGETLGGGFKGMKDKVGGFFSGMKGMFSKKSVSNSLGDSKEKATAMKDAVSSAGDKVKEKVADTGALAGGGKSKTGGFLKSIANAVKKFGDKKVLRGALTMGVMAGTVGLLAIGLKQFIGLDFITMGKGLLALTGLALVSKLICKASKSMLMGSVGILALGAALIPLAFGLNLMKDVGMGTIGVLATGIIALGVAAAVMGMFLPMIALGALAIGLLGAALLPFAYAAKIASEAMGTFVPSIVELSHVDGLNLIAVGAGLAAIGVGLVAMSGGNLLSSLLDGIGKLFGAKSPMEKVTEFAKGLEGVDMEPIVQLGEAFKHLGGSLDVIKMFNNLDPKGLRKFAESVDVLTEAMIRLDQGVPKELTWWEKMTQFAGKLMGTSQEERVQEQMDESVDRMTKLEGKYRIHYEGGKEVGRELRENYYDGQEGMDGPASDSAMSQEMYQIEMELKAERNRYSKLQLKMIERNAQYPGLYSKEQIELAGEPMTGQSIKEQRSFSASGTYGSDGGGNALLQNNTNNVNNGTSYVSVNAPKVFNDEYSQGRLNPIQDGTF